MSWATDFTLSSASDVTQDGITVSFAKGSGNTAPTWYAAGLRLYVNNTITISSSSSITSVTFNWEKQGSKAFASASADVGTYSHPTAAGEGTWSGSANSITFTVGGSGQLQLNTLSVTTSGGGGMETVLTPTFTVEEGTYLSTQDVEIECGTAGASIYYTIDGSTPTTSSTPYSSAISVSSTTTVKAIAVKDGMANSAVASATYTIVVPVAGYTIDFESPINAYTDWTFVNVGTTNTAITAYGGSKYGANINESGNGVNSLTIKTADKVALPNVFTCYVSKVSSNTTNSTWTVEVSSDGSDWTAVGTQSATSMSTGSWTEFTANLSGYSDVYVRLTYSGSTAIRAVDDISITMRDPSAKVTPDVTIDASGLTTDLAGSTNVAAGTITATVTSGGNTIASPAVTWTSDAPSVATVNETTGAVTLIAVGTATITASFAGNDDYNAATDTYELTVIDTRALGGENNPYTVAQAKAAIDAGEGITNVYVHGIVCTGGSSLSSGSLIYWISDDGSDTDKFEIYKGKGISGASFASTDDIQVGDVVTVYGNLTKYNTTYEFATGSNLVSLVRKVATPTFDPAAGAVIAGSTVTISTTTEGATIYYTTDNTTPTTESTLYSGPITINADQTVKAIAVKDGMTNSDVASASYTIIVTPTIALSPASINTTAAETEGSVAIAYTNLTISDKSDFAVQFYDSESNETSTPSWIDAEVTEDNGDYVVYYTIGENTSTEVRTAYFKVYAMDDESNLVYSNLVTVSQAGMVVDYATLPFSWAGGTSSEFTAVSGATADGIGDYAAQNAPYRIKFDTNNDYIQIKTDGQPGVVFVDVKMIGGGNTSFFTVMESANGSSFTEVETLSISGEQNDVLNLSTVSAFNPTTRYVRLTFTKGSNVGVGAINITKPVKFNTEGYATFASTNGLNFSGAAYTAWIVTAISGDVITFSQVTEAPANTGLLLMGTAGETATFTKKADATLAETNLLEPITTATAVDANAYYGLKGAEFVKVNAGTVPAGKALLDASKVGEVKAFTFVFEDATGIESIQNSKSEIQNAIFDLSGRRVSKAQKGIYIVNGKKVVK